jgi:hypothetical protein
MASFKFLLDNDVRGVAEAFPRKQVVQLSDIGLATRTADDVIVEVASLRELVIVTHNRKDYERFVPERISQSTKKDGGCTQVNGLIILLQDTTIGQIRAIKRAQTRLKFNGKAITWKDVHEQCLKIVIEDQGTPTVTQLPRCPHCPW